MARINGQPDDPGPRPADALQGPFIPRQRPSFVAHMVAGALVASIAWAGFMFAAWLWANP